jgi:predicted metal-dependent phosphoesterase TrpH
MLFELHCHSTYSDGKASPKQIVEYAKKIGLSGIAVTDHDSIKGGLEAVKYAPDGLTVIPGMEVSSQEGHILGINIRKPVLRDLPADETVDMIHSLGGLAIAAHPYDRRRDGVGDLILSIPFDAVEAVNGHTFGSSKDPKKACQEAGIPMVGGSDAHTLPEIGLVTVEYEGDILSAIKTGKTAIKSKPAVQLMLNHGIGIIKRKLL